MKYSHKEREKKILNRYKYDICFDGKVNIKLPEDILYYLFVNRRQTYTKYPKHLKIQCHSGANRTIKDIFRLCKHYFPEITYEQVVNMLRYYMAKNLLSGYTCYTIHHFVLNLGYAHDAIMVANNRYSITIFRKYFKYDTK